MRSRAEEEGGGGSQEERRPSALTPPDGALDDAGPISPAYGNVDGSSFLNGAADEAVAAEAATTTPREKKRSTRSFMKTVFG